MLGIKSAGEVVGKIDEIRSVLDELEAKNGSVRAGTPTIRLPEFVDKYRFLP